MYINQFYDQFLYLVTKLEAQASSLDACFILEHLEDEILEFKSVVEMVDGDISDLPIDTYIDSIRTLQERIHHVLRALGGHYKDNPHYARLMLLMHEYHIIGKRLDLDTVCTYDFSEDYPLVITT